MKKILSVVLVLTMLMTLFVPFASAQELDNSIPSTSLKKEVYANGKVWFDLNGNAKFFINTEADDYADRFTMEFLPGVDYSGFVKKPTGDFATDKAAIAYLSAETAQSGGAAMPYTTNKNPKNPTVSTPADFKTDADGNYWYTFEENAYLVRPTENVIKVISETVDTSAIADETVKARYASLKAGTTIDVPDGKYKNFGFLMAARFRYSKSFEIQFKYKEDAEAEKVTVDSLTFGDTAADLYFKPLASDATSAMEFNCQHGFTRIELETKPEKTLESVHIKDRGTKNTTWSGIIFSAWGVETTLEEKIAELTSLNPENITVENYETVKASVEEIDTYLVNYNTALTEEQKVVYDTAKANLSAYENALAQEKLYAANTEWFDLNGNAKFFINKEDTDAFNDRFNMIFLPGVDYSGFVKKPTGVFAKDKAATTSYGLGGAAMPYTIDNNPATLPTNYADFVTGEDGNLWYTFEENTYLMRPEEKVIKVAYEPIDTSALSDTETIERYQSLKRGTTVDVPDKNYENIGLLLAIRLSYSKALEFSFYYKGEAEPVVKRIDSLSYGNTSTADLTFAQLASSPLESWNVRHAFTRVVLDSEYIDSSKVLEKIHISDYGFNISTGAKKNHAWPGYIISMWGDEVNLEGKIDTLEALIAEGIADREEFLKAKGIVETIDNDLAEKGITNSALKAEDKAVYDEAKAAVEGYKATFKAENVNLVIKAELEFEGNSRLFVEADDSVYTDRANYKDYLPGVDFAGFVSAPKGDFATDQSKVTLPNQGGAMFVYTVNKYPATEDTKTIPDFSLIDGKHYWTVDGVPYLVRVNKNVIKLAAGACTIPADMDESKKARYKSLKEGVVVDVPDGKYNSIGFLAGAEGGWRKSYDITLYYEGEENPVTTTVTIDGTMNKAGASYKEGTLNLRTFLGTTTDSTDINFVAQEVIADSSKVLTAVKFADNIPNGHNPTRNGIIVSVWGKQTIKGALSEINENTSKKEIEIIVDAIEKTLAENDITADDLTDETKAKYNLAKVVASALEVKSAEFADSKVTVSYETGVDTGAKVIVAEYDDEDETLFNKATIIPVEFNAESKVYEAPFTATGSKVKVFVWKDMINFFPYK